MAWTGPYETSVAQITQPPSMVIVEAEVILSVTFQLSCRYPLTFQFSCLPVPTYLNSTMSKFAIAQVCVLLIVVTVQIPQSSADEPIRFERDVRPILSDKCFHCHGPDEMDRQADLRLDLEEEAGAVISPGSIEESELLARVFSDDAELVMPPPDAKKPLSEFERTTLRKWVEEGAIWTQHWSFVKPQVVAADAGTQSTWPTNPIDQFVFDRLKAEGLEPSQEADPTTLIRRVTYDLTGIPPTLEEVDAYLEDESENAYENLVDRLLASKRFGERMAVMWLDAARYGDTSVYHADGPRDMWAWRDTVVKAYNDNMPFDRFSVAQLAADYLPDATLEEQILGGFNRNNGTTDEGGAFAEEYRVEYCVDRVKTTSTIWLGLTFECAQCHDHKYDPISQEEYYQFYAFFNVSADAGMQTRKGNATPIVNVPDPAKQAKLPSAEKRLAEVNVDIADLQQSTAAEFGEWTVRAEKELSSLPNLERGLLLALDLAEGKGRRVAGRVTSKQPDSVPGLRPLANTLLRPKPAGNLKGKVEWVSTPLDKGLRFSGDNFVDVGDVADFERNQSFSYGGWVKPTKTTGALLARMDDGNAYRGYDLYVGADGVSVHLINSWPQNAIKVTTKQKLERDVWVHVFATYDGSSKASGIKIFINGEEAEWRIEQDGLHDTIRTSKSLLVGSRHPGSRFKGEVDTIRIYNRLLDSDEIKGLAKMAAVRTILATSAADRTADQKDKLRDFYLTENSELYVQLTRDQRKVESEIEELRKPLTTVMVMRDMQKPRDTFVLSRGAYDSPTENKVNANTISALPPMSADLPRNRLGLAQWLFSDDQPLTSRVTMNRYWQLFFGTGLVDTPQDFGAQGSYPSHPELLDWLAVDFREHGWNIKRSVKQIVMSATYRQTSRGSPEAYAKDPANRLLARGPRFRLQAEFIRDMSLAVSGLLDYRLGGPGVKPYQPEGLWVEVGLSGKPAFKQDHGNKLYRRSLYTYWKRSAPPPTMQIFDAPTREKCTLQRPRTNTPLQALVVLNDPAYVEAARKLAEGILKSGVGDDAQRIKTAFRKVTSREPNPVELDVLSSVLADARSSFEASPERATQLLKVGESTIDLNLDKVELAAWTVVASTLFNLDETLTRE